MHFSSIPLKSEQFIMRAQRERERFNEEQFLLTKFREREKQKQTRMIWMNFITGSLIFFAKVQRWNWNRFQYDAKNLASFKIK